MDDARMLAVAVEQARQASADFTVSFNLELIQAQRRYDTDPIYHARVQMLGRILESRSEGPDINWLLVAFEAAAAWERSAREVTALGAASRDSGAS